MLNFILYVVGFFILFLAFGGIMTAIEKQFKRPKKHPELFAVDRKASEAVAEAVAMGGFALLFFAYIAWGVVSCTSGVSKEGAGVTVTSACRDDCTYARIGCNGFCRSISNNEYQEDRCRERCTGEWKSCLYKCR